MQDHCSNHWGNVCPARYLGSGKIGLRGRRVVGAPFPDPPPLLGSRDGALKKVIDGGK